VWFCEVSSLQIKIVLRTNATRSVVFCQIEHTVVVISRHERLEVVLVFEAQERAKFSESKRDRQARHARPPIHLFRNATHVSRARLLRQADLRHPSHLFNNNVTVCSCNSVTVTENSFTVIAASMFESQKPHSQRVAKVIIRLQARRSGQNKQNIGNFCHTGTISQHCTVQKNGITSSESIIAVDTLE
jgi:hypothetical protein